MGKAPGQIDEYFLSTMPLYDKMDHPGRGCQSVGAQWVSSCGWLVPKTKRKNKIKKGHPNIYENATASTNPQILISGTKF